MSLSVLHAFFRNTRILQIRNPTLIGSNLPFHAVLKDLLKLEL